MFMDLAGPLLPGAETDLTLIYDDGSSSTFTAQIRDFSVIRRTTTRITVAENSNPPSRALSRRRLLGGGAAALAVAGTTWGAATVVEAANTSRLAGKAVVPSMASIRVAISTPPQAHGTFIGFDLRQESTEQSWSES